MRLHPSYVNFGCLNILSINSKFDDVIELLAHHCLSVLCLTETWHDVDSAVIARLRSAGFSVVDRPRLRVRDDLSVNHGGVAIITAPGITLSSFSVGLVPTTFEVAACHIINRRCRVAVVVVYRPG